MAGMYDLNTGKPINTSGSNAFDEGFTQNEYSDKSPYTIDTGSVEETQQNKSGTGWSRVSRAPPQALAALNSLMAQLQTGGSEENKFFTNAREEEVGRARGLQGQFSPEAARTAGTSLISKSISDALAQLMPGITAASEGSGTSKGSMRALLTQKAGERGAIEGAALAANLSSAYGGIQANLEATLNDLTKQDPNSPLSQLAQLIIGSKGIVENTDRYEAETSRGTGSKASRQLTSEQLESKRTNKVPLGPMEAQQGVGAVAQGGRNTGTVYRNDPNPQLNQPGYIPGNSYQADFESDYGYGDNYGWSQNELATTGGYGGSSSDMDTTYTGLTSGSEESIYGGEDSYYSNDEEY